MEIYDAIYKSQSSKLYTALDIRNGFFHVSVAEDSRKYTSFVANNGQYEFLCSHFRISNSPLVVSSYICAIFRELIQDGTITTYMDDIVVSSLAEQQKIENLKRVLELRRKRNLSGKNVSS